MAKLTPVMEVAIERYIKNCKDLHDAYWKANGFTHEQDKMSYTVGRRYIKVIQGHSVHSFIDLKEGFSGDIYKPASCSAPAKHKRGNLWDENGGMKGMTPFGPAYLR